MRSKRHILHCHAKYSHDEMRYVDSKLNLKGTEADLENINNSNGHNIVTNE